MVHILDTVEILALNLCARSSSSKSKRNRTRTKNSSSITGQDGRLSSREKRCSNPFSASVPDGGPGQESEEPGCVSCHP